MCMHKRLDLKFAKVTDISSYAFPFFRPAPLHVSTQGDGKLHVEPAPSLTVSSIHQTTSKTSILLEVYAYTSKKRINILQNTRYRN